MTPAMASRMASAGFPVRFSNSIQVGFMIIPEVGSDFQVLLTQFHPSIELSVTIRAQIRVKLTFNVIGGFLLPSTSPSSLRHGPTAQVSAGHTIATLQ
jgi:hypothetical protein